MKFTKTILAVAIVIAGFASVGCGSDVSGGVSIADAREDCILFGNLTEGFLESLVDALFIEAESFRDDGLSESAYILRKVDLCRANFTEDVVSPCVVCFTSIAAVVWP